MKSKPKKSSLKRTQKKSAKSARSVVVNAKPKAGRAKSRPAKLQHIPWDSVELETLNPLIDRHFIVGQNIMVSRVLIKKGGVVPEHSHYNEQITYILDGALKFWIDGREIVVKAGEVLTIPPHMPHRAEALVDTIDLDVFNPPREDWMAGTDRYLREGK
jgi:quercetin dioxygenase-like cupin family protein